MAADGAPIGPRRQQQRHEHQQQRRPAPISATEVQYLERNDRNLFPLNTDYDLFSVGPNGKALASLIADFSLDDVIRADNGNFVGMSSAY